MEYEKRFNFDTSQKVVYFDPTRKLLLAWNIPYYYDDDHGCGEDYFLTVEKHGVGLRTYKKLVKQYTKELKNFHNFGEF